ncbi:MAG TPA: hypothetical protein VEJ67_18035 [Candidatus Cybelea sp.]|nr:hypothetical protein [Candidatus Cybelea sp.]
MADWRQIQARIRKAKGSTNPSAKLSELYQRTRDAMVAFELAVLEEKNGRPDEAAKWYVAAADRFRRAEWKRKAEEALARLGVEVPAPALEPVGERASETDTPGEDELSRPEADEPKQSPAVFEETPAPSETAFAEGPIESQPEASATARPEGRGKRRRGRRGGRGRRRKSIAARPAPAHGGAPAAAPADTPALLSPARAEFAPPQLPSERTARGRAGDPGLASRMAYLESMLRRLLSSPLYRLDELGDAPAGPGVFLLSDSDQVTSYYIESCQTLRIGLGNLARGGHGRGQRGRDRSYPGIDLKEKLAEHLGINQSKVTQYIKDHCIVRWLQLDEEAPHLAHFAIGVLRTPLNLG